MIMNLIGFQDGTNLFIQLDMNGQRRFEMLCFMNDCEIDCYYQSKQSSYYKVKYNDVTVKFCISDHHGIYRGNLPTVISKKRKSSYVKKIAWDLFNKKY